MGKTYFLGIDPGKAGGYALGAKREGDPIVASGIMPISGDLIDVSVIADVVKTYVTNRSTLIVIIEKVQAMSRFNKKTGKNESQGVTSMFTFGKGFGQLIGMCQALGFPYALVAPQTWKGQVLRDTTKDKDAAIAYVERMFPDINLVQPRCRVPHNGVADAVCLMQWGMLNHG